MNGAGGTGGGTGRFFLGLVMMCAGFYLLLSSVVVSSSFGLATALFGVGGHGVTGGMVLVPLVIGLALVFYNARNVIGWLLTVGAFAALVVGVIASVHMNLRAMNGFELLCILVLAFGGLGLFLGSLRAGAVTERAAAGRLGS